MVNAPEYTAEQLYDLSLLDSGGFEAQFIKNPFGIYNPLNADLSQFELQVAPRLAVKMEQRIRQSDGYALLLLFVFVILVFIMNRNQQYVRNMFQALFNLRLAVQFAREQVANRTFISLIYVGIFNLLLALYILEWVAGRMYAISDGMQFVWVLGAFALITSIYVFKYFFYKLLGMLLSLRDQVSFYLSETFLVNRVLVFVLLPAMAALYFAPAKLESVKVFILLALALGAFWRYFNAIRYIRTVVSAHVLHFILYFCAVEIIPTAVIVKFLLNV